MFIGIVTREKESRGGNYDDGITYTLRVEKWFKGDSSATAKVFTQRNSGGEYLDVGKRYLVYAYEGDSLHPLVIGCMSSAQEPKLTREATAIGKLLVAKGPGTIRGVAYLNSSSDKPIGGAAVQISSSSNNFALTTDQKGAFRMSVPPGKYRVQVVANGKKLLPHVSSYEDQDKVSIQPGQCADFVFGPD